MIDTYVVEPLPSQPEFVHFTSNEFRRRLLESVPATNLIAVVGRINSLPAGMAVAEVEHKEPGTARIHSIVVCKPHRRLGIATALLTALENQAISRGCAAYEIIVVRQSPHLALNGLIDKCGWPALEASGILCETSYESLSRAGWMKYLKMPFGWEVFPWTEINPGERMDFLRRSRQNTWFPQILDPFEDEGKIDPSTSLGLKSNGKIIGWCIFHRISNDLAQCKSLFVQKEIQGRGHALSLAAHALHLHGNRKAERIVFDVSLQNRPIMDFVRRGVMPYLSSVRTIYRSRKQLVSQHLRECAL